LGYSYKTITKYPELYIEKLQKKTSTRWEEDS
jgi:hypothetical protein